MARWVKLSDRLPTKADADINGNVVVMHPDNSWSIKKSYGTAGSNISDLWVAKCGDLFWLENVPRRPKPRTLEDAVKSLRLHFMHGGSWGSKRCNEIIEEMREILERSYNG